MLGCKVNKMGKGNEKNFRAPLAPPYVWLVAVDPWQLSGPGGKGGGGRVPELRRPPPPVMSVYVCEWCTLLHYAVLARTFLCAKFFFSRGFI